MSKGKTVIICFCISALIATACVVFRYDKINLGNALIITDRFTGVQKIVYENGTVAVRGERGDVYGPRLEPIYIEKEKIRVWCNVKWHDGKLYYAVTVKMAEGKYNMAINPLVSSLNNNITVLLRDKDDYDIVKLPIGINSFMQANSPGTHIGIIDFDKYGITTPDDTGENPVWLIYSSEQYLQKKEFKEIKQWAVSWKL